LSIKGWLLTIKKGEAEVHSFDPNIAQRVGISAAVIYQNIFWWCQKNAANEHNIIDGLAWSYNSVRAFTTLFPYLTAKQVRIALTVLEDEGLILVANHNTDPRDRTKWYSICDQNAVPDKANGSAPQGKAVCPPGQNTFAPQGEPLPVSKPDINTVGKPYDHRNAAIASPPTEFELADGEIAPVNGSSPTRAVKRYAQPIAGGLHEACESLHDEFEQVWAHFPRKVGKGAARAEWVKARRKATYAAITGPLGLWIKLQRGTPTDKIPHLRTWLHQERWTDDQTHARNRAETTSDRLDWLGEVSTTDQCDQIAGPQRKLPEIELRFD
jgi:hypothetical protein